MSNLPEVLISFVFLFSYLLTRSFAHPATIQPFLWMVLLFLLKIFSESFIGVNDETRFIFVAASAVFSLSALMPGLFIKINKRADILKKPCNDFSILIIIITLVCLFQIVSLTPIVFSLDYFGNLRTKLTDNDGEYFGLPGTFSILLSVHIATLVASKSNNGFQLKTALSCWFVVSLLISAKFTFLFMLISILFIKIYEKEINLKKILIVIALFLTSIFVLTFIRHSSDVTEDNFFLDFAKVYVLSAVPAFSIDTSNIEPKFTGHTFRVISLYANRFGADFKVPLIISAWTLTPLPTNVYTYLHNYYLEMGFTGILIFPSITGFIHGYFHRKAMSGSNFSKIYSSLLMYPLFMQIFAEQYFSWISNWIYFMLIIIITQSKFFRKIKNLSSPDKVIKNY